MTDRTTPPGRTTCQREDSLIWALRFHENRTNVTPEGVVAAAKLFESYVYGDDK